VAVPVGEDQVPHLELTREIARRFNHFYGPVFPEPQPRLTPAPRLPGTDGRKMSKSYGNAIFIGDGPDRVSKKVDAMLTDTQRTHRHIPGDPEICPVFACHTVFSGEETVSWAREGCRTAGIGCRDCKSSLKESILARMEPIARRRKEYSEDREAVRAILRRGAEDAREAASNTMADVRKAMNIG
jgi:tryptophanyl-tRNA synthetase